MIKHSCDHCGKDILGNNKSHGYEITIKSINNKDEYPIQFCNICIKHILKAKIDYSYKYSEDSQEIISGQTRFRDIDTACHCCNKAGPGGVDLVFKHEINGVERFFCAYCYERVKEWAK